jgi:regulator of replication initiation timing
MEEKNLPAIIEKVEKGIGKSYPMVYPISNLLRKELKDLKAKEIGDLKQQVKAIKEIKLKEFMENKKNKAEIEKQHKPMNKDCEFLNIEFEKLAARVRKEVTAFKSIDKELAKEHINIDHSYDSISRLNFDEEKMRRQYTVNSNAWYEIGKKIFEERYGAAFDKTLELLTDISTKFDEAVLFADLEEVKSLYFQMKKSSKMFDKIRELKV